MCYDLTQFDEDTLWKVYVALEKSMSRDSATKAVNDMLDAGILFRERLGSIKHELGD